MLSLHVGCGPKYRDGWVNIDPCGLFRADVRMLLPQDRLADRFGSSSADEIYMCDVLEHFYRFDGIEVLRDFFDVLKPDGRVTVVTPDLERLIMSPTLTIQRKTELIRGAQGQPGPIDSPLMMQAWREHSRLFSHPYTWTDGEIRSVMAELGFRMETTTWRTDWEMVVTAVKPGG